jgi:DNA invertase Pin-like site-specific DNA recombinase
VSNTSKIQATHRSRTAIVYVRQSSLAQVRDNTESTARQYALADEAVALGWPHAAVQVIDADLGRSGRSAEGRDGFRELVSKVCLGEVGAIFGLEISRLARSSADLSRLLELARLTDTLVVDADGVYDLADFNDRLLLGLKGTMSEAELHLLAGRLQGAKRAAAQRGELRTPLPVGYVYDDEGVTVIDPDAEVAAAVADVFAAFAAAGSAYGVVAVFKDRRFPLRAYGGAWAGQLRWGRLTHARVLGVLNNPAYAGAYVYGRYVSRRRVDPDGHVHSAIKQLPRAEWAVCIQEHHDGYISWDDYLANEAKIAKNRTNAGARPPREGIALCQGIIWCGSCARQMSTRYHRDGGAAYECSTSRADQQATSTCRSITASTVDDLVAGQLLDVLTPAEVAYALAAADEVTARRSRTTRAAELAVERAQYDADRAERAFHATEPENRLVARSLETRWETKLAVLTETQAALQTARDTVPALPDRASLESLVKDMPALWNAETTSAKDRKRLLRTLIADITLLPEPDQGKARIGIRWHTGATDEIVTARALRSSDARRTPPETVKLVREFDAAVSNDEVAATLNTAGHRSGLGRPFTAKAVQWIRHAYRVPPPEAYNLGELSVADVAALLGVGIGVVYYWIGNAQIDARRGKGNRLCITWNPKIEAACRRRIAQSCHLNTATRIPNTTGRRAV